MITRWKEALMSSSIYSRLGFVGKPFVVVKGNLIDQNQLPVWAARAMTTVNVERISCIIKTRHIQTDFIIMAFAARRRDTAAREDAPAFPV